LLAALAGETILAALVLIAVVGGMLFNKDFLTVENWSNLLANFVEIALMALPLSLIVITNEIDLSVASMLGLSSSLLGLLWGVQARDAAGHRDLAFWWAFSLRSAQRFF